MRLCNDGEFSSFVVFIIIITIKRRDFEGGGFVMWVCTSLGCKARVGVYRCSCPVWVSGTNTLSDVNLMMAGVGRNM